MTGRTATGTTARERTVHRPAAAGTERRRRRSRRRRLLGTALGALLVLGVVVLIRTLGWLPSDGGPGTERLPGSHGGPADGAEPTDGTAGTGPPSGSPSSPPPTPPTFDELLDAFVDLDPDLTGSGTLVPVPGTDPAADPDAGWLLRYRVDVEEGLPIDPEFFAEAVHRTLSDPRSWGNDGERGFARVSSGDHDFVITLASPGTTAEWCAKSGLDTTVSNVSCDSALTERIMINAWRWAQGSDTFGRDIRGYRQMLINHEVGHRIGYGHQGCAAEGAPAPVMMQQTKSLSSPATGHTCTPNPWPHP